MNFKIELAERPNHDDFCRRFYIKHLSDSGEWYTVADILTATSHCCGLNSLQCFRWGVTNQMTQDDWTAVFDLLSQLRYEQCLSWNVVDLVFYSGDEDSDCLKTLINHPYVSQVWEFKSRSGYGRWEHPVRQYHICIPKEQEE